MAASCLRGGAFLSFSPEDLRVESALVTEVTAEEGLTGYQAASEASMEETVILSTDSFSLAPGAYRVRISYQSQVNYQEGASIAAGMSYLNLDSASHQSAFDFSPLLLRDGTNVMEQTVQIHSLRKLEDLELSVSFYGLGEVTVYSIEVEEITANRMVRLLGALLLFVLADGIVTCLFFSDHFKKKKELCILTLICLAGVLPFCTGQAIYGHDTTFHVQRIAWLAQELANGNCFPAIYSGALNGFGYAAPLFYCPLFLYVPAILYNCGCSLTFVYNFYLGGMTAATCLITYYCALNICKKSSSALLAAALYTFSAVRLTNVFTRAAFGELTAQTFLPLVVLGFYRIYSAPKGEKITVKQYWPIIAGLTGVVASHALTTVMSAMMILVACLVLVKKTLEPRRFLALARAALLTFCTSAAILVPMLDSLQMDLETGQTVEKIQSHGTYLLQLFNVIVNNYQGDSMERTASGDLSLSIGFSLTLGLVFFLIYLVRRSSQVHGDSQIQGKLQAQGGAQVHGDSQAQHHSQAESNLQTTDERQRAGLMCACWGLAAFSIFLSSIYMFYDFLDFLPQPLYSVLTIYQFPWRWLVFAVLFGTFGTATVCEREELTALFQGVPAVLLIAAALVMNTGQIYADQLRSSEMGTFANDVYAYFNEIGEGEYLLNGSDLSGAYYSELKYDEETLTVGDYRYEDNSWKLLAENTSGEDAVVDIPVFHYDNYAAFDADTGEVIEITTGENNRIRLMVAAGYSGTIVVKYVVPLLWRLAIAWSMGTDLLLIGYAVLRRMKTVS
ncbi:MAG: hypothetical protein LUC90_01465 [Lachnospiraceae bacterium]|nr:hypothetical protein [Lachnospiraceae bacterium]